MVKFFAPSALALGILGWAITVYITSVLLSGTALETRSCQTGCIQVLFFSGLGIGLLAVVLSGVAAVKQTTARVLSYGALVLALPLFAIYAGIILIGKLA